MIKGHFGEWKGFQRDAKHFKYTRNVRRHG